MGGDVMLRSKRELIEKFIEENLPHIADADKIEEEFDQYWQEQKVLALGKICEDENLDKPQFKALIDAYIYSGQEPIRDDVFKCLDNRPSILQARHIGERIIYKMKDFVAELTWRGMIHDIMPGAEEQLSKEDTKAYIGFDPMGNGGVIHERRHSLTWMLSKGINWEETDLST